MMAQLAASAMRDVPERWPVISSEELASGGLVRLRRDQVRMPDGTVAGREVVEHPGAVAVVALNDAGQVLMIRQYRHPVGRLLWEIPAGLRDADGEPPLETAERELREETGYRAARWQVLTDFFSSPGISTERLRVYLARDLEPAERCYEPEHEEAYLVLEWVPLAAAVTRVLAGDLHNGVTAIGILSAYAALRDGTVLRDAAAPER